MQRGVDLAPLTIFQTPFPHFHVPCVMSEVLEDKVLRWFEADAPWRLTVTEFYEQYEFSLLETSLPTEVATLCDSDTLNMLRCSIESSFKVALSDAVEVTAHKLTAGHRIGIHNDYIPGKETHRLLIQLNRDWIEDWGGMLLLFHNSQLESVSRVVMPVSSSALGFAISSGSYHAVSKVHKGCRFTLVYSFSADESVPGK